MLADFSCGYCSPAPPALPPSPPPSATCFAFDYLDANSAPGACSAHLSDGTLTCSDFAGTGPHAGQCNLACQLNILEHPRAYMGIFTGDLEENVGAIANLFSNVFAQAGASDAASFVPLMEPGLCRTLILAFADTPNDICTEFLNIVLPESFGGQGACDFACNRCHSVHQCGVQLPHEDHR